MEEAESIFKRNGHLNAQRRSDKQRTCAGDIFAMGSLEKNRRRSLILGAGGSAIALTWYLRSNVLGRTVHLRNPGMIFEPVQWSWIR
jgi:hypothetical protein